MSTQHLFFQPAPSTRAVGDVWSALPRANAGSNRNGATSFPIPFKEIMRRPSQIAEWSDTFRRHQSFKPRTTVAHLRASALNASSLHSASAEAFWYGSVRA